MKPSLESLESRSLMSGLTPAGLRRLEGFGPGDRGAGVTIAVVDAYNDPSASLDLLRYSRRYGLPRPDLDVINLGVPDDTAGPEGWSVEIALDIETIHALLPLAKIDLVEAASNSLDDLVAAERYAGSLPGVVAVSNSWGSPGDPIDSFGLDAYEGAFDAGPNIVVAAAAGDASGYVAWPAMMPDVVSVGGMVHRHGHRQPWLQYTPTPDVRMAVGGPHGLRIASGGEWFAAWGTSLSCPVFCAMVGAADAARSARGESPLGTGQVKAALTPGETPTLPEFIAQFA